MVSESERKQLLKNALRAVEDLQARLEAAEQGKHKLIAIVGMSCRFPGGANTPERYWELLREGTDLVGSVPEGRWSPDSSRDFDVDSDAGYDRYCFYVAGTVGPY